MAKTAISDRAQWVREYFREHPTATVREAVRAAYEARNGMHWDEVSRIHRELLPELRPMAAALEQQLPKLRAVPHPPPEQRPRRTEEAQPAEPVATDAVPAPQPTGGSADMAKKPAAPLMTAELAMPLTPEEIEHGKSRSKFGPGIDIRKRYLNAYLDKNPTAGLSKCLEALNAVFGQAMAVAYVQETRRLAQAAHNAPAVAAAPPPAVTPSPPPKAAPAPAQAAPGAPKAREAVVQWGPQPAQSIEDEFRGLALRLRALCEREGLQAASLMWSYDTKVQASFVRKATLEV